MGTESIRRPAGRGTTYALIATSADHFLALGSQLSLNAPQSLVVTAHSLTNGTSMDLDFVGTPSYEDWNAGPLGPQCMAPESLAARSTVWEGSPSEPRPKMAIPVIWTPSPFYSFQGVLQERWTGLITNASPPAFGGWMGRLLGQVRCRRPASELSVLIGTGMIKDRERPTVYLSR